MFLVLLKAAPHTKIWRHVVQLRVEREPMAVLVRFLWFLIDFRKGFARSLAIIAKKSCKSMYRHIDASTRFVGKNRSMRRCLCQDQKTLRFTFFSGFDYVVVLGGMVAASTGIGHRMFNEFLDVIAFFTYLKLFWFKYIKVKWFFMKKSFLGLHPWPARMSNLGEIS